FVRRRDQARLGPFVARIHWAVAQGLRPDVPLFTRRLADGLGFAEDPTGSQSFGQQRCRLVAEALWQSYTRGEVGRETRAAALASAFLRAGLDPLRPHLGPGSRSEADPEPLTMTAAVVRKAAASPEADGSAKMSSAA